MKEFNGGEDVVSVKAEALNVTIGFGAHSLSFSLQFRAISMNLIINESVDYGT